MKHSIVRFLSVGALCASVTLLAACAGDPVASATERIDALPHIGDGRKIEYHRILEADEAKDAESTELIYRRAKAENDLVGQELRWADDQGKVNGEPGRVIFNEDGTISGDQEVLILFGAPTHWQKGVSKFRMCWNPECDYYSSWTVMPSMTTQAVSYKLYLEGLDEKDSAITLSFNGSYPEGDEPITYTSPEYTPKEYSEDEETPQS